MPERPRFSQRHGHAPIKDVIQVDGMDVELRNALWSAFYEIFLSRDLHSDHGKYVNHAQYKPLFGALWLGFFKRPTDALPPRTSDFHQQVRDWFFKAEWYFVYDFVEFVARASSLPRFTALCNKILEREVSGYRLVEGIVAPITDQSELAAIESALDDARGAGLAGVQEHLRTALGLLSDRKEPDYRNSIKESISAVESIAKIIAADPAAYLAKALRTIDSRSRVPLHGALKDGFLKLYGYGSDQGGIRHALSEAPAVDFADAKYMLATCSAFVTFLMIRAAAVGISLGDAR